MEADMKLLTLNVDPVCIPDTEYDAVIRMSAVDLHRICKDFKEVSTTIRIRTTEEMDGVTFSCCGDMGTMQYSVKASSADAGGLEVVKSAGAIDEEYPLRHLVTFAKAHNMCKRVEIYMKPQKPILLRYSFMRDGEILFLLAPRIPDDMDEDDEC